MVAQEIPNRLVQTRRLPGIGHLTHHQYQRVKRIIDVVICISILPFLILLIGLIALIICLDSPGSPIFIQERTGQGGRRFKLYKFRSMWVNHDQERDHSFMQAYIAGKISLEDARQGKVAKFKPIREEDLTRVGKFLRKASLDELPQVLNVLRGDMSLIGPRPNVLWEVEAYLPWHYERLNALPGITGLAQIMGRSDITFDQIARYDIKYVRYQDLRFDMWIFWQTIRAIVDRSGAG